MLNGFVRKEQLLHLTLEKRDSLNRNKKASRGSSRTVLKRKEKKYEENVSGSHLFICTEQILSIDLEQNMRKGPKMSSSKLGNCV